MRLLRFLSSSIHKKLIIIVMIITSAVLFINNSWLAIYDINSIKNATIKELELLSDIIGKRVAPLMIFSEGRQANKILTDLSAKKSIMTACIYSSTGEIVANYHKYDSSPQCPDKPTLFGSKLTFTSISTHNSIMSPQGQSLGSIYILSDVSDLIRHIKELLLSLFAIITVAIAIVYLITLRLQRYITGPIQSLKRVAMKVSNEKKYDLRAEVFYPDEIGSLAKSFNDMMQVTDELKNNLEKMVKERTKDLEKSLTIAEKERDRAEKADKHKSEWLRNMSHEFRTPIHGIVSFASFGLNEAENEDVSREDLKRYFQRIVTSTERLQYLVNGILDLARGESGKTISNFMNCDIKEITQRVLTELSGVLQDNNLKVTITPSGCGTNIVADPQQIAQVIANLMGNAIKFSPKGGNITINFSESVIKKGKLSGSPALKFSISDEGCGIPPGELGEIFEVFKQSSTTNDQSGGSGLGLSISKNIIKSHKGDIWAENGETKGAIFSFIIPVSQDNPATTK